MLYIPTSTSGTPQLPIGKLSKGQLYNIDNDQFMGFQFNPETFEWERETNWALHQWTGDSDGEDRQFIGLKKRTIELSLLFISDPRAPQLEHTTERRLVDRYNLVDFDEVRRTIEDWEAPIDGLKRPSRLALIYGKLNFEVVIVRSTFKISDMHGDLTAREALIVLELEEWRPILPRLRPLGQRSE